MNKPVEILFWIRSSRGTDSKIVFKYDRMPDKDTIKEHLEDWCSSFGAWQVSDNMVSYGYTILRKTPKDALRKRWTKLCEQKRKLDEKYNILRARLMANERKVDD